MRHMVALCKIKVSGLGSRPPRRDVSCRVPGTLVFGFWAHAMPDMGAWVRLYGRGEDRHD